MAITRSQRALEVWNRCVRAVNLLQYVAQSGGPLGEYRYRVGMISPAEQDLLVWLVGFIVISATRAEPPEGEWVDQESLALTQLFNDDWMENVAPHLPPMLRNLVNRFRTRERTRGGIGLIRACEERTSPRDVLLRLGFWVVDGDSTFHMVGRGRVVEDVVPEGPAVLVFEPVTQAPSPSSTVHWTESSSGDCPQFDTDRHYIESSVENSPETETEEAEDGEDDDDDDDDGPDDVGS
jgi:hypothetical protein